MKPVRGLMACLDQPESDSFMNKLLVAVFNNETAADAGLNALRTLHAAGDITLYATGVLTRDAQGVVSVRKSMDAGPIGTATGLAVGSLIGLLGGPLGVVVGAATGSVVGAVRDYWAAGVGLDFIEEATQHLQPGKTALVAEVEEEWIMPRSTSHWKRWAPTCSGVPAPKWSKRTSTTTSRPSKAEIKELESEASPRGW